MKEVEPAGLLYYTIDDPIADLQNQTSLTEEDLREKKEQEIMMQLRGSGLVNEDREVIEALDTDPRPSANSMVIPVKFKKDLTLSATSSSLTTRQFELMEQHVKRQITSSATEIAEGNVKVAPYRKGNQTGCEYCEFKEVCGFDRSIPGFGYRELKKMNKDEVMQKLVEEEQHGREEVDA